MDDKHPSTSGEKRKSPCDTNYDNEHTQETPQGNSAPQPERDSAPQPERDSAPQPERDSAPQPEGNSAPQPERDSAPQPERDSAPQPERDSAPQPERDSAPQPERDSAPQPVLKKIRIKVRYRNVKKIYSTQLENHRENAINPVQTYEEMMEVDVETPAKE
uniref:SPANX N member 3 n=1 Tax=Pongo pygmaeus TaxID=9600 RepID=Q6SJ81_PONPY|nr:SPANX N member 3 [Pongo pygmaeus]